MISLLAIFLGSAFLVVLAGTSLARNGDIIAARTRLGGLWVGSVFLAVATSLPELTTDIAAVRIGAPDLAAGDLFGSTMANMLILAIVTLLPRGGMVFQKAALDHALYASLAIIMTCIAAVFVMTRSQTTIVGVGPGSILLVLIYIVGSRAIYRHSAVAEEARKVVEMGGAAPDETQHPAEPDPNDGSEIPSLRRAVIGFAGASLVILIAAPFFARAAASLAELSGVGTTFFGTWLVGFATSLPELVTSLAAVRMKAYDLAVGNLFGSNALNMAMFIALDLAHPGAPILGMVNPAHALSAMVGVILMAIALAALVYRARGRFSMLEPGSMAMIVTYIGGLLLIYLKATGS